MTLLQYLIDQAVKAVSALFGFRKPDVVPPPAPQPAPAPTPAPGPPKPVDPLAQVEVDLLIAHNAERRRAGRGELRMEDRLSVAARKHAQWMARHGMSHRGEGGSQPWDRTKKEGYPGGFVGENVAYGQRDVAAVMSAWMHSSGHKKNILSANYSEIGLGVARDERGRTSWCAVFGRQTAHGFGFHDGYLGASTPEGYNYDFPPGLCEE